MTHLPRLCTFVCVIAVMTAGRAAAQTPAAPSLLQPSTGASVTVPLTISWSSTLNPSDTSGGYNWQVSRSSTFSTLVLADSTSPATTQDVVSGLVNGTYFWRVQAVNAVDQSAWSQARSFNVTGAGPGTPGTPVLAPTRGYTTFHPWEFIHFDWSAVPDAVTYRLEVSNDPNFPVGASPVESGIQTFWNDNIPTNSDGYVHTMIGNWFARVFAVDADNPQEGVRSLPSNVIEFSVFYDNPIGPPPQLISPIDNPTLTLPVTLAWAHVPNPQAMGYVLEIATDPGFSNIEFFYNQYTEPTQVFVSLTSGPKFWRVLSQHGLSSPTTNANTDWSATGRFTISSAPATPVSITIPGNEQPVEYSGAERRVDIQLTAGVPPGGATVALSSSHPTLAPLPATFSMPGGQAWARLPIRFGQVTVPTLITLTATLNGVSASSQFTLRPPTLNNETLQPEVRATGGATMTGWVDLEGGGLAGPTGFRVNLSTNSPAASVPATVTIPAGVSGTGFSIQTSPVSSATTVTVTATAAGVTNAWQIFLTPAPAPTSFFVRPISTTSGSQGVVTTATGLGQDQLLQVTSSRPSLAAVPSTVTVFAGSGVGYFDIVTSPVAEPTEVTISVSGGGVTLSRPLRLYSSLPPLTSLTVSPSSVVGGASATGTVRLGSPAPAAGVYANLWSNLPNTASVPESVFIPGGATSASFEVRTFPSSTTSVQLSAQLNGDFQFSSITVNPSAPSVALSAVTVNPTSVNGGSSTTGTVTLSAGAPSGGAVVSLSDNSSAATVPGSVTVAAGATSANFTVSTSTVTTATPVTITGTYNGASRTVSLTVNPGPPAAPTLVSPANGATVTQPVTFDWNDVAGAASYTIEIDNSSGFTAPLTFTQSVTVSQAAITGLPAQQLFWRVRAVNSAGTAGAFSSSRSITVQTASGSPSLASVAVSPTSVVGGTGATATVTLSAAAASGGLVVTLSSSNATVASVPASVTVVAGATTAQFAVTTTSVTSATTVTITGTGGGATRTATLTVNPQSGGTLPAPSLVAPANDARFNPGQAITFDWSNVTGAASYTIQIDNSETFSAPFTVEQTTTSSQFTTSTLPTTRMWWRVRANSSSGTPGAWSTVRRVEVKN
jgi:hypothetical protein